MSSFSKFILRRLLKMSFIKAIQKTTKKLDEGNWYEIVRVYSKLKLSFGKDKLSALSGVAKVLSKQLKDIYLAGPWRSNLTGHVCWSKPDGHITPKPKHLQWRAPSWSWAATDGCVAML